jgi:hypothetical protein
MAANSPNGRHELLCQIRELTAAIHEANDVFFADGPARDGVGAGPRRVRRVVAATRAE